MPPTMRTLAKLMKVEKTRSVREGTNPSHLVDVYRDGRRILRVGMGEPDDAVMVLYNAPGAMFADQINVAADSWEARTETNPITGKSWELGDMDQIAREDLGLHRGILREGIMLMSFDRDGEGWAGRHFYTHDRETNRITWEPEPVSMNAEGGRFPAVAKDGFARPDLLDELVKRLGAPPEGVDVEVLKRKCAVTWVLHLPRDRFKVIEGPKGPPLSPDLPTMLTKGFR
jgi:hypothetical protein